MNIIPIGERVLIKTEKPKEERTKTGLFIPKSTNEKKEGTIIEVGLDKNGHPLPLVKGDKVIYGGYSSEEIEVNGEKHVIVEFKDIVAKIKP